MIDWIAAFLVLSGAAFSFLAAVGVLRMPDLYSRLQTATKASTLGVGCIVLAAALDFDDPGTSARALLVGLFMALTSPIAAQMIGRAAYAQGVPMWHGTIVDELESAERGAARGSGKAGSGIEEG